MASISSFIRSSRAKQRPRENIEKSIDPGCPRGERQSVLNCLLAVDDQHGKAPRPEMFGKALVERQGLASRCGAVKKILEQLPDVPDDRITL